MVKVPYTPYPTAQAQDTPTHSMQRHVTDEMFGAAIARGYQNIGRGFEQFANSMEKIQNMMDEPVVEDATTKTWIDQSKLQEDFKLLPGEEQKAKLEDHLKALDDIRKKNAEGMTVNQKMKFDSENRTNTRHLMSGATNSAVTQFRKSVIDSYTSGINRTADGIYAHSDDADAVSQDIDDIKKKLDSQSTALGISDKNVRDDRLRTQMGNTLTKVIDSMLNNGKNPQRAKDLLNLFKGKGVINEGQYSIENDKIERFDRQLGGTNFGYGLIVEQEAAKKKAADEAARKLPGTTSVIPPTRPDAETGDTGQPVKPEQPDKRSDAGTIKGYENKLYGAKAEPASLGNPHGDLTLDARAASDKVRTDLLHPEFRTRLNRAIEAAEKATGAKAEVVDAYRDPKRQAQYYANYTGRPVQWQGQIYRPQGHGGLAAPPGQSRHQLGMAADLRKGAVLQKLHEWQSAGILGKQFGLEFLGGRAGRVDPVHIQLIRGVGTRA